jgi:hypothetical protein
MTTQKAFYALVGGCVAIVAAGAGLYYYFTGSLETLNNEVSQLLADQEVIGEQISAYEETEKQVAELFFVNELASEVLPDSKEQANVVAQIKQFVTEAGLQLETLSFNSGNNTATGLSNSQTEAVTSLAGVRVLPATAVISQGARYEDVLRLLQTIEDNQRKMQVTEISLSPIPGSDRLATITLKVNIYLRAAVAAPVENADEEV